MKQVAQKRLRGEEWLRDVFDYEANHPIAFASPRAVLEARLIALMDKSLRPRKRTHGKRLVRRRANHA